MCVTGPIDVRKHINGLAAEVEQVLEADPLSHAVFLFCNRERRILKALYWDHTGFAVWMKRLEKHQFPWPQHSGEVKREIDEQQLRQVLSGIDFWAAHEKLQYTKIS